MTPAKAASYSIPFDFILNIGLSILTGRRRSFSEDALKLAGRIFPPVYVTDRQNIPREGNFILTANHYTRPGLNAWWIAIALSSAISTAANTNAGHDIHWMMTNAWVVNGKWYSAALKSITRRIFLRLAKVYGFSTTPPIPGLPEDMAERAVSVRKILSLAHAGQTRIIGYLPEGRDFEGSRLGWPPDGSGRFVHQLNRMGYKILPAGLYEEDGQLRVRFGEPYDLGNPHSHSSGEVDPTTYRLLTRRQIDLLLTRTVMRRIAILLPEALRGEFG